MERLTEKTKDCFGYRLKDGSDAEVGYFKDYNAFYSHMMRVKALGEYEDLEELIGIPMKDLAEIFRQNIPEDCKHPQKAVVLTDDDVDKWEKYKDFATVFRKKMTETACELLSDKEEFSKWLDRNIWIAKKCDEYARAEEQGLLLRLPCKVGDTVYVKMASYCDIQYAEAEVRDFTHFTSCGFCVVITSKHFDKQNIPFSEFGKTVFLTQTEAEQKLKEIESE